MYGRISRYEPQEKPSTRWCTKTREKSILPLHYICKQRVARNTWTPSARHTILSLSYEVKQTEKEWINKAPTQAWKYLSTHNFKRNTHSLAQLFTLIQFLLHLLESLFAKVEGISFAGWWNYALCTVRSNYIAATYSIHVTQKHFIQICIRLFTLAIETRRERSIKWRLHY